MRQSMHARRMARRQKRGRGVPKLNLVSLMDIFTILVFFLLVNSSEVEVLQNNKSIKLPESVAEQKPDNELMVMVSKDGIVINGRPIATLAQAANSGDVIEPLKKELGYQVERKIKKGVTPEEREKGFDVTIMGDASIPYKVLKKIMSTCALSEYRNISLAVEKIEAEDPEINAED